MDKGDNPPPYSEGSGASPPPAGFVQTSQPYPTQPYPAQPYPQQHSYPPYGQPTVVNVVPATHQTHQVLVVGACPSCRVGILEERFTCPGICCCILFFPLGLICLFTMRQKVCINCGAHF